MHYLKCCSILFLIIPTLFLASSYSSVSFGATDKAHVITPSKIICCKDDTSAGSDSTSTSLASPLKKVSTKPIQSDEAVETEKTDSTSTSLASPLKKVSTKPIQSDEAVETEQLNHESSKEDNDKGNLSDLIQTNLGKLRNVNPNEIEDNDIDAKDNNNDDNTNDNDIDAKDNNNDDNTNDNDIDAKDNNNDDNTNDRLDELRTIVSSVFS